jgi:hypothetical protein
MGAGGQRHAPNRLIPGKHPVPTPRPDCFIPGNTRCTRCMRGWVGPGAVLDRCGKSRPIGIRSPDRPDCGESLSAYQIPPLLHASRREVLRHCNQQYTTDKPDEMKAVNVTAVELLKLLQVYSQLLLGTSDVVTTWSLQTSDGGRYSTVYSRSLHGHS